MTNSVIAKNEPKNSNVKTFKKPKKLKNLNILSLKIIEKKQYYIYIYIYIIEKTYNLDSIFFWQDDKSTICCKWRKRRKREAIRKQKLIEKIKSKQKWMEEQKLRIEALLLQGKNNTNMRGRRNCRRQLQLLSERER